MEIRWLLQYLRNADSLFSSVAGCFGTNHSNSAERVDWKVSRGNESSRTLTFVPNLVGAKGDSIFLGSEIEVRILAIDNERSRIIVTLKVSKQNYWFKDKTVYEIANTFPINRILSLGATDRISLELLEEKISKSLGSSIGKTLAWHLEKNGFRDKPGFEELHKELEVLVGPNIADLFLDQIIKSL